MGKNPPENVQKLIVEHTSKTKAKHRAEDRTPLTDREKQPLLSRLRIRRGQ